MALKKVDLETTQLTLEDLLAELDNDTEILLTRGIEPVARIAPVAKENATPTQRILGLHEGEGWMSDDFDDELSDAFWLGDEA